MQNDMNHPESLRLSRADSELLDRLLAGETLADVVDPDEPGRAEHVSRLLSLLDQWEAEHNRQWDNQRLDRTIRRACIVRQPPRLHKYH